MRDLVISSRRIRAELFVLLSCFALAELVNVYAIITYGTPWTEVFSQIGFVIILTAVIYIVQWVVRLVFLLCSGTVRRIAGRR